MNTAEANKLILISGTTSLACVFFGKIIPPDGSEASFPSPRIFAGAGITYFGLSLIAEAAPEVAGGLAMAIMLTAILEYGIPLVGVGFDPDRQSQKEANQSGWQKAKDKTKKDTK